MPLDKYKTQVLLLHSEQSTLDNLSSGFTDDFTVHCATSGSEALNTLVETPINIIISAHDLPGMSGLDALREAKKRSPETIGILLAGSKTTDVEALVGDEEVFQVVSGKVTSEGLLTLVEQATKKVRMMTLAESANDNSANMDDQPEHIIMETGENGATIISDGSGQLPALDQQQAAVAANSKSRSVDVLVLTKDQEFLATIRDSSKGMHKVHYANSLGKANDLIRKHKVGVAIVDAAMVGEKIEQLSEHLRKGEPRLVSIVAGRREDGEMLMDLINRGKVYRFLLKPVSPGRARLAVESSVKHHLEAPDAAFKAKTGPAGAAAQPAPPAPKPAAKPKTLQAQKERRVSPPRLDPSIANLGSAGESSPIDDGLSDAFGAGDTSFTETMTGIISSVGKKLKNTGKLTTPSAAEKRPGKLAKSSDSGDAGKSKGIAGKLIAATVAIALVGGGAFFALQGEPESPTQQAEDTENSPAVVENDVASTEADTSSRENNALAEDARLARDRGNIFSPSGYNAVELFAAALAADPNNSLLAAELDAVINQALTMAELAMLESRFDATAEALQRVASADPQNSRLPFLNAQLAQAQYRNELDTARTAIRESRFEDAGFALSVARELQVSDRSDLNAVVAELNAARSEQQVDEVLAKAHARLESGDLLSPSNDNARYYYQLVLTNDANNAAARQGLGVIAGKLAFQARTEIDNGELTLAADTLENARALDPDSTEVVAAATALQNRIEQDATEKEREEAAREARIAQQAEAERLAALQRQADERAAAQAAAREEAAQAAPNQAEEPATSPPQNAAGTSGPTTISVSQLNRTKYAAPKYPRAAQRRNLTGWVDIVFTVKTDGTVGEVEVRDSEPGDTFVNAATKAVEKWEFEPVVENGNVTEQRAGVRLMFALE